MSFLILNGLLSLYSSQNSVITKWSSFKMRMRTTELTVLSHKFAIADPDPQPWPYPYLIVRILRRNEDSDLILFFKLWFIKSNFMPIYLIWIFFFHFELRSDLEPDPIIFLSWARSGEQNFGFFNPATKTSMTTLDLDNDELGHYSVLPNPDPQHLIKITSSSGFLASLKTSMTTLLAQVRWDSRNGSEAPDRYSSVRP